VLPVAVRPAHSYQEELIMHETTTIRPAPAADKLAELATTESNRDRARLLYQAATRYYDASDAGGVSDADRDFLTKAALIYILVCDVEHAIDKPGRYEIRIEHAPGNAGQALLDMAAVGHIAGVYYERFVTAIRTELGDELGDLAAALPLGPRCEDRDEEI